MNQDPREKPEPEKPRYEPPDIAWEEDLPQVAWGLSCARYPGYAEFCGGGKG